MSKGTLLYAQSGGVTAVFNATASTVIQAARERGVPVLAGRNGILGVLREDRVGAATAPQPTAGDVTALVEQARQAGVDVSLDVEGDAAQLPVGVGLTVYRVVQEALTNVVKHAGPAHVDVRVRCGDAVEIEVSDDGRGPRIGDALPSAGQGLIGMRERVELFGGELHVGPRPGGGFRVRATLPVGATAAA